MSRSPYPVGHKKPPLHSRFQSGQSGNPRGRPKKTTVVTELATELNRKVVVRENGKEQKMTKAAALAKSLVSRALGGDMRSVAHLIRLLPAQFQASNEATATTFSETDAQVLERFIARRLALAREEVGISVKTQQSTVISESSDE